MDATIMKTLVDARRAKAVADGLREKLDKVYPSKGQIEIVDSCQMLAEVLLDEIGRVVQDAEDLEQMALDYIRTEDSFDLDEE